MPGWMCIKAVAEPSGPGIVGDDALVAEDGRRGDLDVAAEMTVPAGERRADPRFGIDPGVRPENGAVDDRVLADMAVPADDAERADARAAFDDDVGVDEA